MKTIFLLMAAGLAGHDVLWNGRSIACGMLRDWHDGVQEVTDVQRRGQRILSYGPLRTDYGKKDIYPEQSVGLAVCVPQPFVGSMQEGSLSYVCLLHPVRVTVR